MNGFNPALAKRGAMLLKAYRTPVAKAVTRQVRELVPRYQHVDPEALTRNIELIIDAVLPQLDRRDERPLMTTLNMIMDLRQASGFLVSDFSLACLCVFPVARRFFVEQAPTLREGLDIYNAFEAMLMPLVGRLIDNFLRLSEQDATMPEGMPSIQLLEGLSELTDSFRIFGVDDAPAEERTAPDHLRST